MLQLLSFKLFEVLGLLIRFEISLCNIIMPPIQQALFFTGKIIPDLALTIFALWAAGAFHVIDTGHIGVYKRGGAMLNSWTEPGLHFMIPFITKVTY